MCEDALRKMGKPSPHGPEVFFVGKGSTEQTGPADFYRCDSLLTGTCPCPCTTAYLDTDYPTCYRLRAWRRCQPQARSPRA